MSFGKLNLTSCFGNWSDEWKHNSESPANASVIAGDITFQILDDPRSNLSVALRRCPDPKRQRWRQCLRWPRGERTKFRFGQVWHSVREWAHPHLFEPLHTNSPRKFGHCLFGDYGRGVTGQRCLTPCVVERLLPITSIEVKRERQKSLR